MEKLNDFSDAKAPRWSCGLGQSRPRRVELIRAHRNFVAVSCSHGAHRSGQFVVTGSTSSTNIPIILMPLFRRHQPRVKPGGPLGRFSARRTRLIAPENAPAVAPVCYPSPDHYTGFDAFFHKARPKRQSIRLPLLRRIELDVRLQPLSARN